jgi:hypothetical protein
MLQVLGEEDGGHTAASELVLQNVAPAQPALELPAKVGQVRLDSEGGGAAEHRL